MVGIGWSLARIIPGSGGKKELKWKPRICPKCKSPYWDRPRRVEKEVYAKAAFVEKGSQMTGVDKKEMAQWIQRMESLFQDFVQIVGRITKTWEKGPTVYREVWAEGELPALLERLREVPVPKESNCKSIKNSFEKGIDTQIKAWTIQAKYAGTSVADRIWKPQNAISPDASLSISTSRIALAPNKNNNTLIATKIHPRIIIVDKSFLACFSLFGFYQLMLYIGNYCVYQISLLTKAICHIWS